MHMAKILNLDALSGQDKRELVLGGKTYEVPALTVANFIETARIAQKLADDPSATVADQVDAAVDMIVRSVPEVSRETLTACSLEQLNTITAFIRGDDVEKAETAAAAAAAASETDEGASGN
jgi:hypothetical protein